MWKLFNFDIGLRAPIFLIAGPCVVESLQLAIDTAGYLKEITDNLGIHFIYKSSYDKANRTSMSSFRGLGLDNGLEILTDVKKQFNVPIVTDVHAVEEVDRVAQVVDMLQTPAFLCRQTSFITKVAATGLPVNIKKGQFLAPQDMLSVVEKAKAVDNHGLIMVCERGYAFGYNNLVADMRSLVIMRDTACPVIFDATHSVQLPGGNGNSSGGDSRFVSHLARAATAVGISGIFMETHPNPSVAKSDAHTSYPMYEIKNLLEQIMQIDQIVKLNYKKEY